MDTADRDRPGRPAPMTAGTLDAGDQPRATAGALADFLAECCVVEHDAIAGARELSRWYSKWCEENGERPERQKAFGMQLAERGFRRVKNSLIIWYGIGLVRGTGRTGGTGLLFRFTDCSHFLMEQT